MQLISSNDQKNHLSNDDSLTEIKNYLKINEHLLQTIEITIKNNFSAEKVFNQLDKNLPSYTLGKGRDLLIKNITRLAKSFYELTKSKHVQLQLETIRTDMCRLFHIDNLRQRLLCTYLGPGTEWLDQSNVNWNGLGKGCNKKIVKDTKNVNQTKSGELIMLYGLKHESNLPVVHRSPEIEKDKLTRVLLKIDECAQEEEDV